MGDDRKKSRLEELAGEDKTSEKFVMYISMTIAVVLLILLLGMVFIRP